jgi:membrane fusion protein (multidrug efflux system)
MKNDRTEIPTDRQQDAIAKPFSWNWLARRRRWFFLTVLVSLILGGAYWWFYLRCRVSTNDAYVHADIANISSRIPGTVLRVLVDNDQWVEAGQVLVELDPTDYQVVKDRAEANLARLEADIKAAEITLSLTGSQTETQVQNAQAALQKARNQEEAKHNQVKELEQSHLAATSELAFAQKEFDRYEALFHHDSVAEKMRDQAKTSLDKARAEVKSQDAGIEALKASLKSTQDEIAQAEAQLQLAQSNRNKVEITRHRLESLKAQMKEARAQLKQAELDLSYCTIKAPLPGYIAQRDIQVGNRIQDAQPFMAVVPLQLAYVEANFKETQMGHIRPGQNATIKADIYPGYIFHGKVVSVAAGTGAAFSLLPPENATGNWIKVVRRVPVRIDLDPPPPPQFPLHVGLSLHVAINRCSQ